MQKKRKESKFAYKHKSLKNKKEWKFASVMNSLQRFPYMKWFEKNSKCKIQFFFSFFKKILPNTLHHILSTKLRKKSFEKLENQFKFVFGKVRHEMLGVLSTP